MWGVEFPNVTLPDNLAEAAFAPAERANPEAGVTGAAHGAPSAQEPGHDVRMANENEGLEDPHDVVHIVLPFGDEELEMSDLVGEVWRRTRDPKHAPLSTTVALDDVPEVKGIPLRARDNNHRQDCKSRHDREHKTWQQQLLHISRLLAFVGTSIEQGSDDGTVDLSAKLLAALHMVGDLERKVENFRGPKSCAW